MATLPELLIAMYLFAKTPTFVESSEAEPARADYLSFGVLSVSSLNGHTMRDEKPSSGKVSSAEALALHHFVRILHVRASQLAALLEQRGIEQLTTVARAASQKLEVLEHEFLAIVQRSEPATATRAVAARVGSGIDQTDVEGWRVD